MKKFIICTIIFLSVFLGTATCVVVDGYYNYEHNKSNQSTAPVQNPNSSVLTSLASNVLGLEQFSGEFTLKDNNSINLSGTFAIENKSSQIIDVTIKGNCGTYIVDADIQYKNNLIFINFNNSKIKLSTNDITEAINAITEVIETESSAKLPKIDTNTLLGFLDKIVITETKAGQIIELNVPNLCDLYLLTNKESIPTNILINNINVANNKFSLEVNCKQQTNIAQINEEEYLSLSPAIEYIKPTLLALNENNLAISGQIIFNGNTFFIDSTIKNKSKMSGKVSFGNYSLLFELKNNYLLVELFGKVFKLTLDDAPEFLSLLSTLQTNTAKEQTDLTSIISNLTIKPYVKNDKLSAIDITAENFDATFEITKTYFDAISIEEVETKSIKDLQAAINNFKNIISNEYSLDIDIKNANLTANGSLYLSHNNLNLEKLYFVGNILDTPTSIYVEKNYSYCNINNLKFKLTNQSINNIANIVLSIISNPETTLDLSILEELKFINNIDFNGKTIKYKTTDISAEISSYNSFYKAKVNFDNSTITSTIYPNGTYKYLSKSLVKEEYKDYSEVSDLLSATIKTFEENQLQYHGNISLSLFDVTIKDVGMDVSVDKNENKLEIILTNLPNNSILTYLSSINYVGQTCHLTITEHTVKIYTTTTTRLTGREVVLANKTIPLSEFSIDNLYDILCLRKSYINLIEKETNQSTTINISNDMLDINKDETILILSDFVKTFASDLTIKIKHENSIENLFGLLNIHDFIKVSINLNKK